MWSEKKLKEKLDYIHANPVQRGLVQHPRDWPWSSWAHYAGTGEVLSEWMKSREKLTGTTKGNVNIRTLETRQGCGTPNEPRSVSAPPASLTDGWHGTIVSALGTSI